MSDIADLQEVNHELENLHLFEDFVAVMPYPVKEKTTKSGIIVQQYERHRADRGRVVKVGPKAAVKEGDEVLFYRWSVNEVDFAGQMIGSFLVINTKDILGTYGAPKTTLTSTT